MSLAKVKLRCDHTVFYEVSPGLKDIVYCVPCERARSIVSVTRSGKERISRHA